MLTKYPKHVKNYYGIFWGVTYICIYIYIISYSSLIIPKIHFHNQYFTISNQFKYVHKFNSVLSINSVMLINSVMPLTNLTYVFDIQDIRVTGTVPLGYRPVLNGFITQYGPAGLLTGYKQSNSVHYRYCPAGLLIGVTHQYNSSQYCYLTLLVYQSILNTN